jgi:lactate dehydrogenase-like 2-hydroxyacid dehydrogenase
MFDEPSKRVLVVTRRLPPSVESRIARDYRPRFNADDHLYSHDELADAANGADALVITPQDSMDAGLLSRLPSSVRAIATLSVGFEPHVHPGYRELPNTFLLPHLGSATVETRTRMGMIALDNLDAVLAGNVPPNVLVPDRAKGG